MHPPSWLPGLWNQFHFICMTTRWRSFSSSTLQCCPVTKSSKIFCKWRLLPMLAGCVICVIYPSMGNNFLCRSGRKVCGVHNQARAKLEQPLLHQVGLRRHSTAQTQLWPVQPRPGLTRPASLGPRPWVSFTRGERCSSIKNHVKMAGQIPSK